MKTWNRERKRTRDRLLEYDFNIVPPHPHTAGLSMLYPWENLQISMIGIAILQLARKNGFSGDDAAFWERFSEGAVIKGAAATFPATGHSNNLYLDEDTGTLYYFKENSTPINVEVAEEIGAIITSNNNLYIPIRALLIENTILNCGDAAEYID